MQFIDYYYYEYQTAPSPFASFLSLLLGVAGIVACWLLFKKAGKPGWPPSYPSTMSIPSSRSPGAAAGVF